MGQLGRRMCPFCPGSVTESSLVEVRPQPLVATENGACETDPTAAVEKVEFGEPKSPTSLASVLLGSPSESLYSFDQRITLLMKRVRRCNTENDNDPVTV